MSMIYRMSPETGYHWSSRSQTCQFFARYTGQPILDIPQTDHKRAHVQYGSLIAGAVVGAVVGVLISLILYRVLFKPAILAANVRPSFTYYVYAGHFYPMQYKK